MKHHLTVTRHGCAEAHVYQQAELNCVILPQRPNGRPLQPFARSCRAGWACLTPPSRSHGAFQRKYPIDEAENVAHDFAQALVRDLEAVLVQLPITSLAALPPSHEVRHLVRQILFIAADSLDRSRTPLLMSQKIVQLLYKTPSQLGREIYVALLDQLCHSFEEVAREAITWLIYAEDERKFNVPVTVTLLRSGLVTVSQEDQQLAKLLFSDPRPSLQNFAACLIRECLAADPPLATQGQFSYSLEILNQLAQSGKTHDEYVPLDCTPYTYH